MTLTAQILSLLQTAPEAKLALVLEILQGDGKGMGAMAPKLRFAMRGNVIQIVYREHTITTGIKIKGGAKNFNSDPKDNQSYCSHPTNGWLKINASLKNIRNELEGFIHEFRDKLPDTEARRFPTHTELANHFKRVKTGQSFTTMWAEFMEFKKRNTKESTWPQYEQSITALQTHVGTISKLSDINEAYIKKIETSEGLAACTDSTRGNYIGSLVMFMKWCVENEHYAYGKKMLASLRTKNSGTDIITMSLEEVMQLYNFNYKNTNHRIAVDLWVFMAFTCLRVSDVDSDKFSIVGRQLQVTPRKTEDSSGAVAHIPVTDVAEEIIARYPDGLPRLASFDRHIKAAAKLAELNREYVFAKGKRGYTRGQRIPMFDLISAHVGRATGITFLASIGVNPVIIATIAAIDMNTLKKYLDHSKMPIWEAGESVNTAIRKLTHVLNKEVA